MVASSMSQLYRPEIMLSKFKNPAFEAPPQPLLNLHLHTSDYYTQGACPGIGVVVRVDHDPSIASCHVRPSENQYREYRKRLKTKQSLVPAGIYSAVTAERFALLHGLSCTRALLRARMANGRASVGKVIVYCSSQVADMIFLHLRGFETRVRHAPHEVKSQMQSKLYRAAATKIAGMEKLGVEVVIASYDKQNVMTELDRARAAQLAKRGSHAAHNTRRKHYELQNMIECEVSGFESLAISKKQDDSEDATIDESGMDSLALTFRDGLSLGGHVSPAQQAAGNGSISCRCKNQVMPLGQIVSDDLEIVEDC